MSGILRVTPPVRKRQSGLLLPRSVIGHCHLDPSSSVDRTAFIPLSTTQIPCLATTHDDQPTSGLAFLRHEKYRMRLNLFCRSEYTVSPSLLYAACFEIFLSIPDH